MNDTSPETGRVIQFPGPRAKPAAKPPAVGMTLPSVIARWGLGEDLQEALKWLLEPNGRDPLGLTEGYQPRKVSLDNAAVSIRAASKVAANGAPLGLSGARYWATDLDRGPATDAVAFAFRIEPKLGHVLDLIRGAVSASVEGSHADAQVFLKRAVEAIEEARGKA